MLADAGLSEKYWGFAANESSEIVRYAESLYASKVTSRKSSNGSSSTTPRDEQRPWILQTKLKFDDQTQTGGNINLTCDAWSSSNRASYLGVTAHFLDARFQMYMLLFIDDAAGDTSI